VPTVRAATEPAPRAPVTEDPRRSMRRISLPADALFGVLSAAAAVALASTALLNRADFFLHDDFRSYFSPLFGEVSRLVRGGEFPLLTDRLWYGGAILAEYQLGVLNPVCLALMTLVGGMRDLAAGAAIYALAHIAIFAGGAYLLARQLGCGHGAAFLAGLIAPTSEWIFYWGAGDWIPFLASLAWVPWAWAGLIAAHRDARWTPAAAAGVALVLTAGCPYTDLALLVSIVVARVAGGERFPLAPALAVVCGGLLAAPAILPLGFYLHGSGRENGPMLTANLDALIGVSTPFMVTRWLAFGGVRETVLMPMLQVAWFVAPALVAASWRNLWRRSEVRALALLALVFAAMSMMPGLWQFRWMYRFLPYYQLALAVLAALALDDALRTPRAWRPLAVALALGAPFWVALWQDPRMTRFYLLTALPLALLAGLALWIQPRRAAAFTATLALGHAALFALVNTAYLGMGGRYPGDFPLPTTLDSQSEPAHTRYTIFAPWGPPSSWAYFRPGNSALERPGIVINGYSPFHLGVYEKPLCLSALGSTACGDIAERLSAPFAGSGLPILDLARVEEVRAEGPYAAAFARRHPDWRPQPAPAGKARFLRPQPLPLAAPVSLAPADAVIRDVHASPSKVRFAIDSRTGGRVVLARAWYPGWSATLDGRLLPLRPLQELFVAAELPPNSKGELVFAYWPAGLTLGLAAAAMGLVLLAGGTGILARRKTRSSLTE